MKPLVYLACPYSHPDPKVRRERFLAANAAAAKLMRQGLNVFSPITHCHPIAIDHDLPGDWQFWKRYDRAFIDCSNRMFVLTLDGWEESDGVKNEIEIATELGIEVEYMEQ